MILWSRLKAANYYFFFGGGGINAQSRDERFLKQDARLNELLV
jgi:hypothetical protein